MKIQLQSLRVVNGGPLRDVCIHFNTQGESPVTVLAGANGSGKTNVLNLVVALCGMFPAHMHRGYQNPLDDIQGILLRRTDYAQLDLQANDTPLSLFSGPLFDKNPLAENYLGKIQIGQIPEERSNGQVIEEITASMIAQQDKSVIFIKPEDNTGNKEICPSLLYFPSVRQFIPLRGEQIQREEVKYQWIYRYETVRSFSGSLDAYLIWLDYAEPEIYAQVIDFLNSLDFDGKKFGVLRKELRAVVTTRDGQTHGVAELSSGEQNILIMLLELRRRLLPYSIVLIDEIENSLHPAFQHRLGQALRKMQETTPFQLILTTHASDFARIFGPESVRILTEF